MILAVLRNVVSSVLWNENLGLPKLTVRPKLICCDCQRALLINGELTEVWKKEPCLVSQSPWDDVALSPGFVLYKGRNCTQKLSSSSAWILPHFSILYSQEGTDPVFPKELWPGDSGPRWEVCRQLEWCHQNHCLDLSTGHVQGASGEITFTGSLLATDLDLWLYSLWKG